jgi:hypothetical protein
VNEGTIPNGADAFKTETQRIADEKKQAAQQLAEQIIKHYFYTSSYRTKLSTTVRLGDAYFLMDLAKKYYSLDTVVDEAVKILQQNGWDCKRIKPAYESAGATLFISPKE